MKHTQHLTVACIWAVFKPSNRYHVESKRNDGHNLGNMKSTSKALSLFKKEEWVLAPIFQTAFFFFLNQALKKVKWRVISESYMLVRTDQS